MKQIVPFSEEIVFKSKIAEICSISLEHNINVEDFEVNGDFIISGDYKTHEVSVNKEHFLYRLPFSVELTNNIDPESINFEIQDFTYELLNEDTLKIDIEFSVEAEEILVVEEAVLPDIEEITPFIDPKEAFKDLELDQRDEVHIEEGEIKVEEAVGLPKSNEDETPQVQEAVHPKPDVNQPNEIEMPAAERPSEETVIEKEPEPEPELTETKKEDEKNPDSENEEAKRIDEETQNEIIKNIGGDENTYITYHVHIVRESENLESLCNQYNAHLDMVKQINNIDEINIGDKIIIPELKDE